MAASESRGCPLLHHAGLGQDSDQPHPLPFFFLSSRDGAEDFYFQFSHITTIFSMTSAIFFGSDLARTLFLLHMSCKRNTLLENKHCYVLRNTLFGDINETIVSCYFYALSQLCTSILQSYLNMTVQFLLIKGSAYEAERKAFGLGPY